MMLHKEEVTLGSLCDRITVGHVGPMADSYESSGVPFLRSQDIGEFRIDTSNIKYIPQEFDEKLRKSRLRAGDVAIVRTGYPGTAAVVPLDLDGANCADLVIVTPGPDLDAWFVAGLLNSSWGRGHVSGVLVGVAQQHFNVGAARNLKTHFPPLSTQVRIGSIIKAYCDLIEVNQRRIAILEEMARRLFDEWFVRFHYPEKQGAETKNSELGPIPADWSTAALGEVLAHTIGGTWGEDEETAETPFGAYVLRGTDFSRIRAGEYGRVPARFISKKHAESRALEVGDLIIEISGGSKDQPVGRTLLVDAMMITEFDQRLVFASFCRLMRPDRNFITPLFLSMFMDKLYRSRGVMKYQKQSTGLSNLSFSQLVEKEVLVVPPLSVLSQFDLCVAPMLEQVAILRGQVSRLRVARDLLLPKLISGEIDVGRAEEALARAAE